MEEIRPFYNNYKDKVTNLEFWKSHCSVLNDIKYFKNDDERRLAVNLMYSMVETYINIKFEEEKIIETIRLTNTHNPRSSRLDFTSYHILQFANVDRVNKIYLKNLKKYTEIVLTEHQDYVIVLSEQATIKLKNSILLEYGATVGETVVEIEYLVGYTYDDFNLPDKVKQRIPPEYLNLACEVLNAVAKDQRRLKMFSVDGVSWMYDNDSDYLELINRIKLNQKWRF